MNNTFQAKSWKSFGCLWLNVLAIENMTYFYLAMLSDISRINVLHLFQTTVVFKKPKIVGSGDMMLS